MLAVWVIRQYPSPPPPAAHTSIYSIYCIYRITLYTFSPIPVDNCPIFSSALRLLQPISDPSASYFPCPLPPPQPNPSTRLPHTGGVTVLRAPPPPREPAPPLACQAPRLLAQDRFFPICGSLSPFPFCEAR